MFDNCDMLGNLYGAQSMDGCVHICVFTGGYV